jgi:O-antigen/teichoic acid export membrane protein
VFGSGGTADLIVAFAALLIGSAVSTVVISALQGLFRVALANGLALVYIGMAPLLSILLFPTPFAVLLCTAGMWIAGGLVFALPMVAKPDRDIVRTSAIALFRFGIRRVPGELAAFGLLTIPAILAATTGGIAYAGFVSLAMSMVTLAGAACAPLATVLLPHMSAEFAGQIGGRLKRVRPLLLAQTAIVLFGSLVVFAFMPTILGTVFGSTYVAAASSLRVACFAVPAFCAYVTVRTTVDAFHERAVTMRYALIGFAAFIAAYTFLRVIHGPLPELVAFDLGVWTLAALTLRQSISLLRGPDVAPASPSLSANG